MTPKRIQMTRQRPWRADNPDAVIVARPSRWGNPFKVHLCDCCGLWDVVDDNGVTYVVDHRVARAVSRSAHVAVAKREAVVQAVHLFAMDSLYWHTGTQSLDTIRAELAGRDLACWCHLDQPCHADVLLELANGAGS